MIQAQRPSGLPKPQLREKIVQMYDDLLCAKNVEQHVHFWDEFFVLKPKVLYFTKQLDSYSETDLNQKKLILHKFSQKIVERLESDCLDGHSSGSSSYHALIYLCILIEILSKRNIDVSEILLGHTQTSREIQGKIFSETLRATIRGTNDTVVKLAFRVLLKLVALNDNINHNPFLPYLMHYSFFEDFMRIVTDPRKRKVVGYDVITLLGILPHFFTAEPEANPYMQLSVLDPAIELMGIAAVIGESFRNCTTAFFQQVIALQKDRSWMTWIAKTVTRTPAASLNVVLEDAALLGLCTGLKIGRNFVHAFSHAQSEILVDPPQTNGTGHENEKNQIPETASEPAVVTPLDQANTVNEPSNLFVEFLQYSSIVLQHIRQDKPFLHAKMSLVILCTITEDHYTTQFMHDFNINYRVQFFRAASRYHPCQILKSSKPEPLACAVLNLLSEFIMTHMMLNFPHDLYFRCLLIVYRLMDYQKRTRFRLPYQWRTLWGSLLSLLKFLEANESHLMEQMSNFFLLCTQVVNILNIFLIGGDAILSQVGSYDDLCYEIVRNSSMVNNAFAMGLRYSAVQSASTQAAARKYLSAMTNLRSVINHFTPKIEAFSAEYQKVTMEREEILGVIKKNYDSLSLRLVDMTECFEKHANGTGDKEFIEKYIAHVLLEIRNSCSVTNENCFNFSYDECHVLKE
ncbi:armadillo-like helical domain-containing protein 3 [Paramacrobiotus metropolitanus]|uniref:armadillo-like helical domain-containing protein 3 n=1 Tax=Paramacrobiotus metropolitanus TaxID=2943436 RepID=UPI0024462C1D|nr:armadillo-like helical domain-containing protein 3 [Paramacrobiotus metropolitanus]